MLCYNVSLKIFHNIIVIYILIIERGCVCMNKISKKSKLDDLKERATKRKSDLKYRHTPNDVDVSVVNAHAKLVEEEQYKSIK